MVGQFPLLVTFSGKKQLVEVMSCLGHLVTEKRLMKEQATKVSVHYIALLFVNLLATVFSLLNLLCISSC